MIYLIGGAPRTGKSNLAKLLVTEKMMSSFSTDFLYDIDQVEAITNFDRLDIIEKGRAFFPILERIIGNVERQTENCVIDGDVILPSQASQLAKTHNIKSCFLGFSTITFEEILEFGGHFNWPKYKLENGMADEVTDLVERTIHKSEVIKSERARYNQQYFDLSLDFKSAQMNALRSLLS